VREVSHHYEHYLSEAYRRVVERMGIEVEDAPAEEVENVEPF
jgi:hypothetical protein